MKLYKLFALEYYKVLDQNFTDIINKLPHGSGIDGEIKIITGKKYPTFSCSYHVMNGSGYYTRWIDYTVTIKPSLISEIDITIVGNFGKDQDVKDCLIDLYYYELRQEY